MTSSRGFTMIEVLIAMVILAIGLLGLAALQAVGMRNNHSALSRFQATLSAYDMADRLRSNSASSIDTPAFLAFLAANYNKPALTDYSTAVDACNSSPGCTSADMATNDRYEWSTNLSQTLPAGTGIVCRDSTPDDGASSASPACDDLGTAYAIKIWWQDDRSDPSVFQRFVVTYSDR